MSRILFNIGKGKNITKRDVIDFVVSVSGNSKVDIGEIEIFRRATAVEVESKMARTVLEGMNSVIFEGIQIEAAENYEFTGREAEPQYRKPREHRKGKRPKTRS